MLTIVQGGADNYIAWEGEDPSAVLQSSNAGKDWYVVDASSAPISGVGTVAPTTPSGGKAITNQAPANGTSNAGSQAYVTYSLNFVNGGDYHLYVRRMIQNYDLGNPDNNNSFFAPNNIDEAPGGAFSTFNNDNGAVDNGTEPTGQYDWVGATTHASTAGERDYAGVTAGIHTFTVQTREGGYVIDRIVLAPAGLDATALDALANSSSPTTPLAIQTSAGFGQITMHVSGGPANADTYNIKRSTTAGGPYTTVASGLTSPRKFIDTGLASGTTYFYVASSVTGGVESANSAEVSVGTAAVGNGTGLLATYHNIPYDNTTGAEHLLGTIGRVAVEGPIDFGFGGGSPAGVQSENFTGRWDGSVQAPFTGDYTFTVISDDGEHLFVDGTEVVNDETLHGDQAFSATGIHMDAGTKHTITYYFFERGGGATGKLHWSLPGVFGDQAIPASQLYPSIAGQALAPAATNLTATANGSAIDLTFDDNATDELYYNVLRSTSGTAGSFFDIGVKIGSGDVGVAHSGITFTDSTAFGGTHYYYKVVPVNLAGAGAASNAADAVTGAFDPAAQFGDVAGAAGHYWQQGGNEPNTNGAPGANQLDPVIDVHNGGWALPAGFLTDNFTTEWTGKINIAAAGNYTFTIATDDAGYFSLDGVQLAAEPGGHGEFDTTSPVVNLTAGFHNFDFLMAEGGGGYGAVLKYNGPDTGGTTKVVPNSALHAQVILTAPSSLAANNVGKTAISLSFTDNSKGLAILLERSTASNFAGAVEIPLGALVSSFSDSGLTGNTDYYYRVREAHRFDGYTGYSNVLHVKTLSFDPTPNAPTGLVAAAPAALTPITVKLNWTDNSNNEAVFKIERKDVTAGGSYAQIGTVGANVTSYTDQDAALISGHVYSYRVRANNPLSTLPDGTTPAADSAYSNEAGATASLGVVGTGTGVDGFYYNAQNIVNRAAVFTGLTPVAVRHDGVVDFDFDAGNGGCTLQCPPGFGHDNEQIQWFGQFQAQTTEPYTFSTASDDGSDLYLDTGSGLVQIVDNNFYQGRAERSSAPIQLVAGQKYNIYGSFYQGGGGTNITWFMQTPSIAHEVIPKTQLYSVDESVVPPAPGALAAHSNIDGTIALSWANNAFNGKSFTVKRSTTAGGPYTNVATLPAHSISFSDTNVTLGTTYFYVVSSTNAAGEGANSNESSAKALKGIVGTGDGVDGYYYNGQTITNGAADFTGLSPVAARKDGVVDFNFDTVGQGQRPAGFDHDNEMIQWFGFVQAQETASYTFSTASDDGSDLWLDLGAGLVQVVNNNFYQGRTERFGSPVSLVAGQKYPIYGSFYQGGGGTNITWFWQSPGTPHQVIPMTQLYGAADTSVSKPAAPSGTAVIADVQTLVVTWTDSTIDPTSTDQEAKFIIERSGSAGGPFVKVGEVGRNSTSFTDSTATGTAAYFYRVKASNKNGDSAYDVVASGTPLADPGPINIPNFSSGNQGKLQLNGTSTYNTDADGKDVLQLTDAVNGQSGTAFSLDHHFVDNFTTSFDFRMNAGNDADGITFALLTGPDNTLVGGGGGCLAVCGLPAFSVKFDIYPNPRSHTNAEFNFNGNDGDIDTTATSTVNFLDRDLYHVDLGYDGTAQTLVETITSTTDATKKFTHTYTGLNIPAGLGTKLAYVGFTGATGGLNEQQFIYNFKFDSVKPGPGTIADYVVPGTAGNDTILISHVGANYVVTVNGIQTFSQAVVDTKSITVNADGTDNITIDGGVAAATAINIDGKAGTDSVKITNGAVGALNITGGVVQATNDLVLGIGGSIAATASLDMADHDLIVQADAGSRAAVLAAISGYVKAGRNNGAWTGLGGITSSTAGAQANHLTGLAIALNDKGTGTPLYTTFDGVTVDKNAILVKYSWNGDADLSGKIDSDDYFQIDNGFVLKSTGYRNGDFDFNGVVDASDYFLIDNAFISQTGPLSAAPAAAKATASKSRHHKHKK